MIDKETRERIEKQISEYEQAAQQAREQSAIMSRQADQYAGAAAALKRVLEEEKGTSSSL